MAAPDQASRDALTDASVSGPARPDCHCASLLTPAADGRSFFSSFVCGGVVRHPPPSVPGPWRRSPLGALRARESGTPTRSGVGSLGSNGRAHQDRPQDHPTSATEHERALTTRELALRAVAMGWRRPTDRNPNDRGTMHGFLLRRARPTVPRALGASWSPTSRHVPHSAAPQARRPTVRAVIDREAARRQARRDDARPQSPYRPRVQAASVSGRSGQPRVDSTTQSSLLVNAGLSCVDEGDHGTGRGLEGERERAMLRVERVIGRRSMGGPTRRCLHSSDCWHVRPRVKFSTRPSRSRIGLLKRAANESRHLRPVLVREPTRRVDR
jgi:hypothetical protein